MISEILSALDKGEAQQATTLSESALREEGLGASEKARLLLYRGLARELLGQHDAALHDLTLSLDSHALPADERGQALLQRGFLRDEQGQLEEAASDYTAAAALKDYNAATALNNRANIYRRQNRLWEARRDYLAALSADGTQPQYSYYGLGQIAEAEDDRLGARGFYAKALIAAPDCVEASQRLAALGGPPDSVIAVPRDRLVLRPPAALVAQAEISPSQAIDKKGTVAARRATVPQSRRPFLPVNALVLRPALDQPSPVNMGEVQLGAWRSAAEAHAGWVQAKARAQGVLDGLEPRIMDADLPGKGHYFRLRVSPKQSGTETCTRLAAKGVACVPVRN